MHKRANAARKSRRRQPASLGAIAGLIGSIDRLPRDLSARRKRYLKSTGYGGKHTARAISRAEA